MNLAGLHVIQATTVRANLAGRGCTISGGTGHEGDVVAATVADPGGLTTLIDWREVTHPVTAGTVLVGVLANRDSTTHASGGVPAAGMPIAAGSRLAWLGGQSALLGIQHWSPNLDNTHGAQATGTVEALGLVHDQNGVVNIATLTRTPRAAPAQVPILVVCGTSAEVGKTTTTVRIISALTRRGLTIVAIKPTVSGGIADSLAHRQAGAAATYDLIDCGLPSSYTDPGVFAARIGRCLAYAAEHIPDAVICELGGDVISGNNDIFLVRPEVRPNLAAVLCIAGDAAGALGVHTVLRRAGLGDLPITYAPAYTRNPYTFATRLRRHLGAQVSVLREDPGEWSSRLLPRLPRATTLTKKGPPAMISSQCALLGEPLTGTSMPRLAGQVRDRLGSNKAALIHGFPADPASLTDFLSHLGAPLANYAGTTQGKPAYTLHPNINVVRCTSGAGPGSRLQEQPGPLPAHSARAFSKKRPAFIAMLMIDPGWKGGESTLVRWSHALAYMREQQPDSFTSDYALLSQTPITITASHVSDEWSTLPLLYPLADAESPDDTGARLSLVLASQLAGMNMNEDLRHRYHQAFNRFTTAVNHPRVNHSYQLLAGDLVILDNNRFGHGRLPFPATRTAGAHTEVNPRELWTVILA